MTFRVLFRRCVCITGWLNELCARNEICPRCSGSGAVLELPEDIAEKVLLKIYKKLLE